jgi:hypothetical protein
MDGYGSGRQGGRVTVESTLRLDVDAMIRRRVIQPGAHVGGEMKFRLDDDDVEPDESSILVALFSALNYLVTTSKLYRQDVHAGSDRERLRVVMPTPSKP